MSLTRWRPYRFRKTLPSVMDRLLREGLAESPRRRALAEPLLGIAVDVVETEDEVIVRANLPGMEAENIDVSIVGDTLRLKGEFEADETCERGNVYCRERRYGRFQRYVNLPASVDAEAAEAAFKNGVLSVSLPKSEATERTKVAVKRPFEEI